ncbi:DUF58 domain-containing protein [Amycolatopsis granulosa]|uniref:DUF58 domain-containing protein n=1 Tax=Amycolatopsis granulosa TaxID=185684 RepID=UPI0014235348|nr:DUF58 domain-containing protein [Amycolatopsis granulosa]NIH85346.1 uncharacterized protein (DUF58 family) [Amycolatopsis granulosa]
MAITGKVGLLALVGVVPVAMGLPSWTGVLLVLGVLAVAVAVDVLLAAPVRGLTFARSGPAVVRLGETAEVTLWVTNPGKRPLRGVLRDAWPPSAGTEGDRFRIAVPPGDRRPVVVRLRPVRRGDRTAHRVTVRALGPLGLAGRQGSHRVPGTLRVLPPFTSRKHLPSRLTRLQQLDGRQAALVRGEGTEFDSLREYVIGDDVRSIDWRATARAADVMVRTWRPERDRRVLVVLDTGRTAAGRVGDVPRLDASMDAALLLAVLASRAGDRVDFLAYDRRVRADVRGLAAGELLPGLVTAMAPLEASLVETDARGMVAEVLRRARRRSLVVLLTGLDAAPLEEGLLPVLPSVVARHQLVVAGVADPGVTAMARSRGDAEAVYDAAAAERTLAERRRVTSLLAQRGVTVVDAVPDRLAPALADTYLALKAAGRL